MLVTTAPFILSMCPRPMSADVREHLSRIRDHKSITMVKKYRDKAGKRKVVPGLAES